MTETCDAPINAPWVVCDLPKGHDERFGHGFGGRIRNIAARPSLVPSPAAREEQRANLRAAWQRAMGEPPPVFPPVRAPIDLEDLGSWWAWAVHEGRSTSWAQYDEDVARGTWPRSDAVDVPDSDPQARVRILEGAIRTAVRRLGDLPSTYTVGYGNEPRVLELTWSDCRAIAGALDEALRASAPGPLPAAPLGEPVDPERDGS